jgi:hypothetical protein
MTVKEQVLIATLRTQFEVATRSVDATVDQVIEALIGALAHEIAVAQLPVGPILDRLRRQARIERHRLVVWEDMAPSTLERG